MREEILEKLSEITKEELPLIRGEKVDKALYTTGRDFVVYGNKLSDKPIDIRTHTRFASFPDHGHDFTEMMYVYAGSITHVIDGEKIVLKEGDILLMNKHVRHSIEKAEKTDIGINFIFSDAFLNFLRSNLIGNSLFSDFFTENFKESGEAEYLHFGIADKFPIRNLLDNLIYSLAFEKPDYGIISHGVLLLFTYLNKYDDCLESDGKKTPKGNRIKSETEKYISSHYNDCSLKKLAESLDLSEEYTSRKVKELFGVPFKELLIERRLEKAEKLLLSTDSDVSEIILSVGYENKSYFHRRFREKHGMTPKKFRDLYRNGK